MLRFFKFQLLRTEQEGVQLREDVCERKSVFTSCSRYLKRKPELFKVSAVQGLNDAFYHVLPNECASLYGSSGYYQNGPHEWYQELPNISAYTHPDVNGDPPYE